MALLKIIKIFFLAIYTFIVTARQTDKTYNKLGNIMVQPSDEALHTAAVKFAKANKTTVTYALNLMNSVINRIGITAKDLPEINRKLKELNSVEYPNKK